MIDRDIARKLLDLENLPTLPAVMMKLLEAVEDEASSANDLTAILERDLAISARVLRLANSAFYGLRYQVESIQRAVVVVGFDAVRMLGLAMSVFDTLNRRRQFAFDPEAFWLHSLGAAKAAQLLAHTIPGVSTPESCFTAGLLHDIGKYCLALVLQTEYKAVVDTAAAANRDLHECESEILHTTHMDAAIWIIRKWHLPASLEEPIGYQQRLTDYRGPYRAEAALIGLASDLSRAAAFGDAGDAAPPDLSEDRALACGLTGTEIIEIRDKLAAYVPEAIGFLKILQEDAQ